jgi:sodium-dependent dicarboxylate transporter 2/3/5
MAERKERTRYKPDKEDRFNRPSALWVDIEGPADLLYRIFINRTFRKMVPGAIIFVVLLLVPLEGTITMAAQRTIALFVLVVYLWVSETFPLPVTAFMAGVGLLVLGVYTGSDRTVHAFSPYAADAVFMVLGSLIMAQGLVSSGADRLLASGLLRRFTSSTNRLLFGIILLTSLLSAVVPGHSVAAFMLPVIYSTVMATEMKDRPNEIIAMIIAIAVGCEVGSLATPSGGARNAIAIGYINDYSGGLESITYFEWVELALPLTLLLIPFTYVIIKLVFKVEGRPITVKAPDKEGKEGIRPYIGMAILITTIILFLTVSDTLSLGAVAMIGGVLMFVFGLLRWETARGEIKWGVIFIYGAALTLGNALRSQNAFDWLAEGAVDAFGGLGIYAIITIIVIVTALVTNIMSDAAAVALTLPIVLPIVLAVGGTAGEVDAHILLITSMATAIASGFAYITVFATPPNTIVHASGLVTSKDFLKAGVPIWVASLVIMLILVNTYWKMVL